jgi:hypothetical protein
MDGVAVTQDLKQDCNEQGRFDRSRFGSPAGWFAGAALICAPLVCAPLSFAQAQANAAAPAAALAPSTNATSTPLQKPAAAAPAGPVTLPPQPPPPQLGGPAATAPATAPTPNQAASSVPNQTPAQTQGQPDQSASLPAAPDQKRGFLNDLGKWWDDSVANFNAKMKEQQAKLDEFNKQQSAAAKDATQAMKNAADAMFTPSKVIEVQQPCPVAGNGAPDCAGAATNVCKAKGFSDGRPMDIRTAERCKASLWVSGQTPTAADCPIETVLLRVACQP